MVEHSAVNRVVAGSSPARGVDGLVVKRLRHRPFTAVTRVRILHHPFADDTSSVVASGYVPMWLNWQSS